MRVCSKDVSDHSKQVEKFSWSKESCLFHVHHDQIFLNKVSFVDHFN